MKTKCILLIIVIFFIEPAYSLNYHTEWQKTDSINRKKALVIANTGLYTINYTGLYFLWYKNYDQTSFHFFNDANEWMQMDKAGHMFCAYQLTHFQVKAFQWAKMPINSSILWGSLLSLAYISSIEIFDGFSSDWGASVPDITANAIGIGIYSFQEYYFQKQIIKLKYSYNANSSLGLRTDLLGNSLVERLYKDYNSHTIWLSFNLRSVTKSEKIPEWLNLAIGYGAKNMLGGEYNPLLYESYHRQRQFYFSPDIDLSNIKTKSHFLNTVLKWLDIIKFPLPALEFSSKKIRFHPIYF